MAFYRNSGGGVTLSGGEVLAQAAFALDLMAACKRYGIHLALETSGFGKREDLLALADAADCLFYDVKHTDNDVIGNSPDRAAAHPRQPRRRAGSRRREADRTPAADPRPQRR